MSPAPATGPQPDEPRTETTLTTRIRINIPGSRPIPPVVMRTPMAESDLADAPDAERTATMPRPPEPEAEPAPEPPAERPTSDWFAPRKPAASSAAAPPAAPAAPAAPVAPGSGAAPGTGAPDEAGQRPDLPYFSEPPQRGTVPPDRPHPQHPPDRPPVRSPAPVR